MDVKAAVAQAKQYVNELFAEEGIRNVGLEEIDYDDQRHEWRVTIGFSRPWDEPTNSAFASFGGQQNFLRRAYKVVRINDETETVVSVKSLEEKV